MCERFKRTWHRSIGVRVALVCVCVLVPVLLWAQWSTSGNDIYNTNSGNVAIGTATAPAARLYIAGGAFGSVGNANQNIWALGAQSIASDSTIYSYGAICANNYLGNCGGTGGVVVGANNTSAAVNIPSSGNTIFNNGGNVGIGTATPAGKFEVVGAWPTPAIRMSDTAAGYASFATSQQGFGFLTAAGAAGNVNAGGLAISSSFFTAPPSNGLYVQGNVGIGTAAPSAKLDVAGDVVVSGNISAKYQDIAEWVPSTQSIPAGAVVILDQSTDNGVVLSTEAYDTRVAGVISDSPGIILGEAGAGKLKVATTGRVKVRVDASQAPIQRGDLLVTSDKQGVAMRSEPIQVGERKMHQPGTLIGKALEPLREGEGEILVLLSLQ